MQKSGLLILALVPFVYGGTLMEELAALGSTSVIRDLLNRTGLAQQIDKDYLTIFAPSDDAFAKLPDDVKNTVLSNATILYGVLQFHATHGIFRSQDASDNMMLESTLSGSKIRVNVYNDAQAGSQGPLFITLNGAKVLKANIQATNGYLHLIDTVMMPPLGNFYDIVSGSDVHTVMKSVIDDTNEQTLFQTATGTLFAPVDDAFQAVFAALTAKGMDINNAVARKEFLLYHLLESVVYSAGARPGIYTTKDKGEKLTVTMMANGTVMINQAHVVLGDLSATNGVVHIVDSVLVPEPYATALIMG
ncbi:transforming growth factor-beta-induced protein ig-h3 [Aplysia californica]|uniref:Transforming growth factor-beta-induced protein ig-h3 n=1 Tax=Aplysia californica TaxID=6500 RepID=A0ABM1AC57_APLCA|nr:transforming growth factor-beta-induced protein ig-h3 [Aplysia californica]